MPPVTPDIWLDLTKGGIDSYCLWITRTQAFVFDFRYFVTVAETCHFGHAAEQLHIAQPALSQAGVVFRDLAGAANVELALAWHRETSSPLVSTALAALEDVFPPLRPPAEVS